MNLIQGDVIRFWINAASAFTLDNSEIVIALLQQQVPYFVANKGALVSNPVGAGVVFGDDGFQSVYGESAFYNGQYYSINRPDLWPVAVTLDFGSGLKGIRRTGTTPAVAANTDYTITVVGSGSGLKRLISYGGQITMANNMYANALNGYWTDRKLGFAKGISDYAEILTNSTVARSAGLPYDVWCTYQTT
jgi:hypothetical protein